MRKRQGKTGRLKTLIIPSQSKPARAVSQVAFDLLLLHWFVGSWWFVSGLSTGFCWDRGAFSSCTFAQHHLF